jgi:hypothetical protein
MLPLCIVFIARPIYKYITTGSIEGSLKQVARCVIETFYAMNVIKSNLQTVGINVEERQITITIRNGIHTHDVQVGSGEYFFNLTNLTPEENKQSLKAIREILDPIVSPRYIVERRGLDFEYWITKDYHSVPEIIGRNKKDVERFFFFWKKYVSPARLIYTRTFKGRKILLKVRKKAFSNQFRKKKIHELSKWG